jgi:hypothetical protein
MRGKNWPEILIGGGTKNGRDYKMSFLKNPCVDPLHPNNMIFILL